MRYTANYSQGSMPFAVVGTHPKYGQPYRWSRHHTEQAARAAAKRRGGDARAVRQGSGGCAWVDLD